MLGAYLTEKPVYPLQRPNCQCCLGTVWGGCGLLAACKGRIYINLPYRVAWSCFQAALTHSVWALSPMECRALIVAGWDSALFSSHWLSHFCKVQLAESSVRTRALGADLQTGRSVTYEIRARWCWGIEIIRAPVLFVLSCGILRGYNKLGVSIHLWTYIFYFFRNFCLFRSAKSQICVFWLYHVYPSAARI